jgi:hypothetical protein
MKVYIGKYGNWVGPYQIANLLRYVGLTEDNCHAVGEYLADTWLNTICQWIEDKKSRTIKVRIDKYDTWSMDNTLAHIIVPMLKQLKATTHGAPNTDDKDVPEKLRTTVASRKKSKINGDVDANHFKRWDWILDEMIWAFEQMIDDDAEKKFYSGTSDLLHEPVDVNGNPVDAENAEWFEIKESPKSTFKIDTVGLNKHYARIANGTRLFGKYFQALWD